MRITIGSTASQLARRQVSEASLSIQPLFGSVDERVELLRVTLDAAEPVSALFAGEVDLLICSAESIPSLPTGVEVAALLPARDTRDALVYGYGADENAIQTIGVSSPCREAYVQREMPEATAKIVTGSLEEQLALADAGEIDAVIVPACDLHRLDLDDRVAAYLDYETAAHQGRLAILARSDNAELLTRLRAIDVRRTGGLVALIGCPAEFTLLSQRAINYLHEAEIVLHDRLLPPEVLPLITGKSINCGKTGHQPSISQAEIHRRILHAAEERQLVVRLHGGDPGILGHLGETLEFLSKWNLRADVLPAVTAAQLAAARARAPLTHRDEGRSVTMMSGHSADGYNPAGFRGPEGGNLAVYMGIGGRESIQHDLQAAGWPDDTSVIVGERLGYDDEAVQYLRLNELAQAEISRPAVLLVGPNGFPSLGYTLFVGTDPEIFLRHGPLLHLPLIRLDLTPLTERAAILREAIETCDGIIFPSRIAVRAVIEAILYLGDVRLLAGKTLLAVGPSTERELARHGLKADAAPRNFGGAAALARELGPEVQGRYLYPCSDAAPVADRAAALADCGIELDGQVFYRNTGVKEATFPRLPVRRVLFSSGSTARAYFRLFPEERQADRTWLAVGTSTLKVLTSLGVDAEIAI